MKIGKDYTVYKQIMGKQGLGEMNENGETFADFCSDHICVSRIFRRSLLDVRVRRGADAGSKHYLLIAKVE